MEIKTVNDHDQVIGHGTAEQETGEHGVCEIKYGDGVLWRLWGLASLSTTLI
jgi:hypothetical protein